MAGLRLVAEPLSARAFAPFGEVIAAAGHRPLVINEGWTERYHALAAAEVGEGRAILSIFRTRPKPLPMRIRGMERHPRGSQAFIPLQDVPYLVLVAEAEEPPAPGDLRLFLAGGKQGVNYRPGIWHHYCLALERTSEFLVVDREGPGDNLEEMCFGEGEGVVIAGLGEGPVGKRT